MYMLDTNICIYAIKNRPEQVLAKIKEKLEYGAAKSANPEKNHAAIIRLLFVLDVLPFGDKAAIEYGNIRAYLERKGTPIGPLDMLIAGHAKAEGRVLVTNNAKEFVRVPGLKVENWAE